MKICEQIVHKFNVFCRCKGGEVIKMMLGMLKSLGNKLVREQSRTWHRNEEELNALPREVQDHLSLDKGRGRQLSKCCNRPVVRTAVII